MTSVLAVASKRLEDRVSAVAEAVAWVLGASVRRIRGASRERVVREARDEEIAVVVLPCRPERGGGSVLATAAAIERPVVLVPQDLVLPYSIRCVLVPMTGTPATAAPMAATIEFVHASQIDVVVLHVGEPDSIPAFEDQTQHETEAWAQEFLARYVPIPPDQVGLELRVGRPASEILEVAAARRADLVALGWGRQTQRGRANVVRLVVEASRVPVALIPLEMTPAREAGPGGGRTEEPDVADLRPFDLTSPRSGGTGPGRT